MNPTGNARWGGGGDSPTPAGFTERKAREAATVNGVEPAVFFRSLHHIFGKMSPRWLLEWVETHGAAGARASNEGPIIGGFLGLGVAGALGAYSGDVQVGFAGVAVVGFLTMARMLIRVVLFRRG